MHLPSPSSDRLASIAVDGTRVPGPRRLPPLFGLALALAFSAACWWGATLAIRAFLR